MKDELEFIEHNYYVIKTNFIIYFKQAISTINRALYQMIKLCAMVSTNLLLNHYVSYVNFLLSYLYFLWTLQILKMKKINIIF